MQAVNTAAVRIKCWAISMLVAAAYDSSNKLHHICMQCLHLLLLAEEQCAYPGGSSCSSLSEPNLIVPFFVLFSGLVRCSWFCFFFLVYCYVFPRNDSHLLMKKTTILFDAILLRCAAFYIYKNQIHNSGDCIFQKQTCSNRILLQETVYKVVYIGKTIRLQTQRHRESLLLIIGTELATAHH